MKKPEIKETKGTFIIPKLKSSYWGPFSGLKTQDLIKTSPIFSGVIFCRRLGLGLHFRLCSKDFFLSGRPQSVSMENDDVIKTASRLATGYVKIKVMRVGT